MQDHASQAYLARVALADGAEAAAAVSQVACARMQRPPCNPGDDAGLRRRAVLLRKTSAPLGPQRSSLYTHDSEGEVGPAGAVEVGNGCPAHSARGVAEIDPVPTEKCAVTAAAPHAGFPIPRCGDVGMAVSVEVRHDDGVDEPQRHRA